MGYYIRVLGKNPKRVLLRQLQEVAHPAVLNVSDGDHNRWEQLTLTHTSGREFALIERNPVDKGQLGAEELQECIDEVAHYEPDSAATWLRQFLSTVTVIYAFQLLSGTDIDDGWASAPPSL